MEITIITPSFPHPKGGKLPGIETYVKNLAISLKNLNHIVKIVTTYWNGGDRYETYKGISILRIIESNALLGKIGSIFHLNYFTFGLNMFRKKNYQFLQNSDVIIIVVAIGFTRIFKIKKFRVLSVFHHYEIPKTFVEFLYLPFFHYLEKRQFKIHQNLLVYSHSAKKEIIRRYKIHENLIQIIPHGIDINKFNPNNYSNKLREKYPNHLILYSGLMVRRKKVGVLLEAISYVIKEIPDIHLVLTGDGPLLSYYKKFSKLYGIEKNTTFLGFIKDNLLQQFYASCDIFVFPSELEGFGQVLLEAMASGTPVICANKPPMCEIIENGGLIFKLNDSRDLSIKIIKLLNNREALSELKKNALKIAKKNNGEIIAKKFIALLRKLINKNLVKYN